MNIKIYTFSILLMGTALYGVPAFAQEASGAVPGTSVLQTSPAPASSSVTTYPINQASAFSAGNVTVYPVGGGSPRVYGAPSVSDYNTGIPVVQGSLQPGTTALPTSGGLTSMGAPIVANVSLSQVDPQASVAAETPVAPVAPAVTEEVAPVAAAPAHVPSPSDAPYSPSAAAEAAPTGKMQPILTPEEQAQMDAQAAAAPAAVEPAPVAAEAAAVDAPPQKPDEVVQADEQAAAAESVAEAAVTPEVAPVVAPAPVSDPELDDSLMHKLALLEGEKEALRKKLLQAAPGDVAPVYNCAAESNKIKELESQVAFLTEENKALAKKNVELDATPKVEPLMETDVNTGEAPQEETAK